MIPLPPQPGPAPVLDAYAQILRARYRALSRTQQRHLLVTLAQDHAAPLGNVRDQLAVLTDVADALADTYNPRLRPVEGPVHIEVSLMDPADEKPFAFSVLRNPVRFRTQDPHQPQLLITTFMLDTAAASRHHQRLGEVLQTCRHSRAQPHTTHSPRA
ncbi:hypothetical protein LO772_29550 [Yinghuangia sp. ASG 101]|uniref:hypothetical protein n=1 Tax=Yinghuangia sp. ASG 101 TaxID=2896848 RepID=UPI001E5E9CBF|nr:hypothetical protein [Yinghuangia sp. ASG 101]UGQ10917.1 hypothetical protein LO772_29550 [Yinghuangia sp. ASG 101]